MWPLPHNHVGACVRCPHRSHRKKHSFLGFIDIDEFLVFTDPGITSVEQLLRPFNDTGGLALHWQLVGSSNHTARPDAPVTSRWS